MLQFARDHVAENFGIAMRVFAESLARFDDVVVDDAKRTEAHVIGIEIVPERERVPAMEPAELGLAAGIRGAFGDGRFIHRIF